MAKYPFISQHVLARLEAGTFVAKRRASRAVTQTRQGNTDSARDRRQVVTPLAIAKRCIYFDTHVFSNRKTQLLGLAHQLNSPQNRLVRLSGPQGSGKTSLIRGVIEMMGGGPEQLMWLDVSLNTDGYQLAGHLLNYANTLLQQHDPSIPLYSASPDTHASGEFLTVFHRLTATLSRMTTMPILVVLDNCEHLLNAQQQWRQHEFQTVLDALLSFPNISIIIVGDQLPLLDPKAESADPGLYTLRVAGLSVDEITLLLQTLPVSSELSSQALAERLHEASRGHPWLMKALLVLAQQSEEHLEAFLAHYTSPPQGTVTDAGKGILPNMSHSGAAQELAPLIAHLVRGVLQWLSPAERLLIQTLTVLRHPVNPVALQHLMLTMAPGLAPITHNFSRDWIRQALEKTGCRPFLKKNYPPQEVLHYIQQREGAQQHNLPSFSPSFEAYRSVKRVILGAMRPEELRLIHHSLSVLYHQERTRMTPELLTECSQKFLLAEARYHHDCAQGIANSSGGGLQASAASNLSQVGGQQEASLWENALNESTALPLSSTTSSPSTSLSNWQSPTENTATADPARFAEALETLAQTSESPDRWQARLEQASQRLALLAPNADLERAAVWFELAQAHRALFQKDSALRGLHECVAAMTRAQQSGFPLPPKSILLWIQALTQQGQHHLGARSMLEALNSLNTAYGLYFSRLEPLLTLPTSDLGLDPHETLATLATALAQTYQRLHKPQQAIEAFQTAVRAGQQCRDAQTVVNCSLALAQLYQQQNMPELSQQFAQKALKRAEKSGQESPQQWALLVQTRHQLAALAIQAQQPHVAQTHAQACIEALKSPPTGGALTASLLALDTPTQWLLVQALIQQQETTQAQALLRDIIATAKPAQGLTPDLRPVLLQALADLEKSAIS